MKTKLMISLIAILLFAFQIQAQKTVTGTVTDDNGDTMPGTSVLVKGTTVGTMTLVDGIEAQIRRVFENLTAVTESAGGSMADIVKLNVFLIDLADFNLVNAIMGEYFSQPYPARAAIGVASLPKGALVEADGMMVIL